MKKEYEELDFEVIRYLDADVVTASNLDGDDDDDECVDDCIM